VSGLRVGRLKAASLQAAHFLPFLFCSDRTTGSGPFAERQVL